MTQYSQQLAGEGRRSKQDYKGGGGSSLRIYFTAVDRFLAGGVCEGSGNLFAGKFSC